MLSIENKQSLSTYVSTVVSYLQVLSLWVMLLALPFRIKPGVGIFPRVAMITAGALFVIEYLVNCRWREWQWNRNKWLYVGMIIYYLYIPLWHIWSNSTNSYLSFILGERIPFLLGGIIGLVGLSKHVKIKHICYVFAFSAVFTSLYIIFRSRGFAFFAMPINVQSFEFTYWRIEYMHSHMFYNIYLNTTLVFIFYLLSEYKLNRITKSLVSIAFLWTFYILCLTEGRTGLITGLVLMLSFILIFFYRRYGWKMVVPIITVYCLFAVFVIKQNQRFDSNHVENEPRWAIWEADIATVKEAPILGHGCCDAKHSFMVDHVKKDERITSWLLISEPILNENPYLFHMHNTYMESVAEFGILGLLTLLFIFLYPLSMLPKRNRIYIMMIVGCFMMQCMFDRFILPMLYVLSIIFLTNDFKPTSEVEPALDKS